MDEEVDQIRSNEDVEIDGNLLISAGNPVSRDKIYLVQEEDVPFRHKPHAQLYSTALSIGDLLIISIPRNHHQISDLLDACAFCALQLCSYTQWMDRPVQVHIEDAQQVISSGFMSVPADGIEEVRDYDIGSHDRVVGPFCTEVDHALTQMSALLHDIAIGMLTYARRVHKDILTQALAASGRGEAFPGEDTQKGRLAGCDRS